MDGLDDSAPDDEDAADPHMMKGIDDFL